MKKHEAIKILKDIKDEASAYKESICYVGTDEDIEAISIAIQALEQETCNDCISREYMLTKIKEWYFMYPDSDVAREALSMIMNETSNAPAVLNQSTIYCKDCYYWTKQKDSLQGRCSRYCFYPTGYYYCAGATKAVEGDEQ